MRRTAVVGRRSLRALAVSVWALTCALAIFSGYLSYTVPAGVPVEVRPTASNHSLVMVLLIAASAGLFLLWRQPGNRIGWILSGVGITLALSGVDEYYPLHALYGTGPAPLWKPLLILGTVVGWYLFLALLIVYLPLLFPDGRLPSPRWRWVLRVATLSLAVAAVAALLDPTTLDYPHRHVSNPLAIAGARPILTVIAAGSQIVGIPCALLALASLVTRYRRAAADQRHQLRWLLVGTAVVVALLVISLLLPRVEAVGLATTLSMGLIPVAIVIAVLRYRLYDIDVVINRAVVYGGLAALITAAYVGIAVGIGALIGGGGRPNLGLSILATAVVAVGFQPARERLQRLANRLVYGRRATPYEVLAAFSDRVATSYVTDDVMPRMARVLAEGTAAVSAAVWLHSDHGWRCGAVWPSAGGEGGTASIGGGQLPVDGVAGRRVVEVRHQGAVLGALIVTKRPGESLTPVEENLVQHLGAQAGLVLKNVGLTRDLQTRLEELRASRQRLVSAQDTERRRLERNLHDGAQQHLVALKVKLGLAEVLASRDVARTVEIIEQLKADADEALETLRDLARGIYPPLLAEKGLEAALMAVARRATVPTAVEAAGLGRYSEAVEAAVYFCVLEALQNVQKYAGASHVVVAATASDGTVRFEVSDDGTGFDPGTVRRGAGLTNMADRLEAIGGELHVESAPGRGTVIRGSVKAAHMRTWPAELSAAPHVRTRSA